MKKERNVKMKILARRENELEQKTWQNKLNNISWRNREIS
jgi:hypothetical protein